MDTPTQESSGELNESEAGAVFASMLDPQPEPKKEQEPAQADPDPEAEPETEVDPEPAEEGADAEPAQKITVEIDGKTVELTKAEIAEHYKNGLRQADYTKKTMEAAEQRKTAQAEIQKAQQERAQFAQSLQQNIAQLDASLNEYQNVDWEQAMRDDPTNAQIHKHRMETRQAERNRQVQQFHQVQHVDRVEGQKALDAHMTEQQASLLAKLPEWKSDAKKAQAEKEMIVKYLTEDLGYQKEDIFPEKDAQGFTTRQGVTDHRLFLMARDAALYREMKAKANTAVKRVENLPQKVERPGVTNTPGTDKRTSLYARHAKQGTVDSAAAVFASLI